MSLIGAITLSFLLHFAIIYIPFLAVRILYFQFSNSLKQVFSLTTIGLNEWIVIVGISFPVILIDEILKFILRNFIDTQKAKSA